MAATDGEARANALWGAGGRSSGGRSGSARKARLARTAALLAGLALAAPLAASAAPGAANGSGDRAYVPTGLLNAAQAHPDAVFDVIVQGEGEDSDGVAADVGAEVAGDHGKAKGLKKRFVSISGVAAEVTGKQLVKLAAKKGISAITTDERMTMSGYTNDQDWPVVAQVSSLWSSTAPMPTIAIVDSGVDAPSPLLCATSNFANRVVTQVTMTSLAPNSPGDGRGHGTFVASIAAGEAPGHAGTAPRAKIVSLDVLNDRGEGLTSDVIAAADWIYQNKDAYNIRVANFSLHSITASSFMYDPLDKAVEKLWFSGVVVVTAAGNYAVNGQESRVRFAPGNDPFVITVGAVDINGNRAITNDFVAPWSAFGHTYDGFAKPELVAPGRYMIGAVPSRSTMALERPDRIVAPGYMQMSGTSFAAPVVAGAAAHVLAAHPSWTPDQVKGALMVTAKQLTRTDPLSSGLGELAASSATQVTAPPNPNRALEQYVVSGAFDATSWKTAARANPAWDAASWSDASWSDASWSDASWSDASWASASWSDASWSDASGDSSWGSLTWVN